MQPVEAMEGEVDRGRRRMELNQGTSILLNN